MITPPALQQGATIALLSPSSGTAQLFPHIYAHGKKQLEALGYNTKEYPSTLTDTKTLYNNPKMRAQDINDAFKDDGVDAIIATLGGEDSVRILKYLDIDAIKQHPKLIMGFSDTTAILAYLAQHNITTFYGPTILAGFSQLNNFPKQQAHLKEFLTGVHVPYTYPHFDAFVNEFPDWADTKNTGKIGTLHKSPTPEVIQGVDTTGKLWGGCWEVLEMMRGTQYWPNKEFFSDKILFLETSEEEPPVSNIRYSLRAYAVAGIFDQLQGIIVGRCKGYTAKQNNKLRQTLKDISKEAGREDLYIAVDLDFGHTTPQVVLPYNQQVIADRHAQLTLIDNPFA